MSPATPPNGTESAAERMAGKVTLRRRLPDALYGKWHLDSENGRLPNDQGFDEWFGIPRTTDEAMCLAP